MCLYYTGGKAPDLTSEPLREMSAIKSAGNDLKGISLMPRQKLVFSVDATLKQLNVVSQAGQRLKQK